MLQFCRVTRQLLLILVHRNYPVMCVFSSGCMVKTEMNCNFKLFMLLLAVSLKSRR